MTDLDLRAGKLEQSCPDCGRWEAAGAYCSGCGRSMGPGDWYGNGDETRRAVAHERAAQIDSLRVSGLAAVRARMRPQPPSTPQVGGPPSPSSSLFAVGLVWTVLLVRREANQSVLATDANSRPVRYPLPPR